LESKARLGHKVHKVHKAHLDHKAHQALLVLKRFLLLPLKIYLVIEWLLLLRQAQFMLILPTLHMPMRY
jgi:hypothetical protein